MYLMVSHIPIYVDDSGFFTDISWQRDLVLARDWLAKPFGDLKLIAPSLPLTSVIADQMQLARIGNDDGIRVVPSFDLRCRTREFWTRQRKRWIGDVRKALDGATVVHTTACDVYLPLAFQAHREGVAARVPTVLVGPDMDPHMTMPKTFEGWGYCAIFDHFLRQAARTADLVLLKDGIVFERYSHYSKNSKAFCHSMHSSRDVVEDLRLEKRLATLGGHRPLRAVYAGRFVARKGLRDALAAVGIARRLGANVEFHLYGGGPEEGSLRRQVSELGGADFVVFHGVAEYGPQFLEELKAYDLLLFMPTEEDTPRMLFDAMAAGLPVLGSRIPFLNGRVAADRMGLLVDIGDANAAGEHLRTWQNEPEQLKALSRSSQAAGRQHSVDVWYRLRSQWTQEMVGRHLPVRADTDS